MTPTGSLDDLQYVRRLLAPERQHPATAPDQPSALVRIDGRRARVYPPSEVDLPETATLIRAQRRAWARTLTAPVEDLATVQARRQRTRANLAWLEGWGPRVALDQARKVAIR